MRPSVTTTRAVPRARRIAGGKLRLHAQVKHLGLETGIGKCGFVSAKLVERAHGAAAGERGAGTIDELDLCGERSVRQRRIVRLARRRLGNYGL